VVDPDPHVRRLVSEGLRPRLPWAPRLRALQRDPTPALARLDPLERTVIALHLEGFDYTEIADVTGLSAGAVGVRIHRIRKRLTAWISPSTP
jgi:DNA-directed RNA polymerase specialized sigma24 family protein